MSKESDEAHGAIIERYLKLHSRVSGQEYSLPGDSEVEGEVDGEEEWAVDESWAHEDEDGADADIVDTPEETSLDDRVNQAFRSLAEEYTGIDADADYAEEAEEELDVEGAFEEDQEIPVESAPDSHLLEAPRTPEDEEEEEEEEGGLSVFEKAEAELQRRYSKFEAAESALHKQQDGNGGRDGASGSAAKKTQIRPVAKVLGKPAAASSTPAPVSTPRQPEKPPPVATPPQPGWSHPQPRPPPTVVPPRSQTIKMQTPPGVRGPVSKASHFAGAGVSSPKVSADTLVEAAIAQAKQASLGIFSQRGPLPLRPASLSSPSMGAAASSTTSQGPFPKPGIRPQASGPFPKPGSQPQAAGPFPKPGSQPQAAGPFPKPGSQPQAAGPFPKPGSQPQAAGPPPPSQPLLVPTRPRPVAPKPREPAPPLLESSTVNNSDRTAFEEKSPPEKEKALEKALRYKKNAIEHFAVKRRLTDSQKDRLLALDVNKIHKIMAMPALDSWNADSIIDVMTTREATGKSAEPPDAGLATAEATGVAARGTAGTIRPQVGAKATAPASASTAAAVAELRSEPVKRKLPAHVRNPPWSHIDKDVPDASESAGDGGGEPKAPRPKWRPSVPEPPWRPPPEKLLEGTSSPSNAGAGSIDRRENVGLSHEYFEARIEASRRLKAGAMSAEDKELIKTTMVDTGLDEEVSVALKLMEPAKLRKLVKDILESQIDEVPEADRNSWVLSLIGKVDPYAEKLWRSLQDKEHGDSDEEIQSAGISPAPWSQTVGSRTGSGRSTAASKPVPPWKRAEASKRDDVVEVSSGDIAGAGSRVKGSVREEQGVTARPRSRSPHRRTIRHPAENAAAAAAVAAAATGNAGRSVGAKGSVGAKVDPHKEWLQALDESGDMLRYLAPLRREFSNLAQVPAACILHQPGGGETVLSCIDNSVFEALKVESLGHRLILAKGILALADKFQ